jgi:hypothetical protein
VVALSGDELVATKAVEVCPHLLFRPWTEICHQRIQRDPRPLGPVCGPTHKTHPRVPLVTIGTLVKEVDETTHNTGSYVAQITEFAPSDQIPARPIMTTVIVVLRAKRGDAVSANLTGPGGQVHVGSANHDRCQSIVHHVRRLKDGAL